MAFTQDEVTNIIKDYKNGMRLKDMESKYNRTSINLIEKLKREGVFKPTKFRFSKDDIEFLKENYAHSDWDTILNRFNRCSKQTIIDKAYKLGLKRECFFWSDDDIVKLKDRYPDSFGNIRFLVELFEYKFTYEAICTKAYKLGIKAREKWSDYELNLVKENYSKTDIEKLCELLPDRSKNAIIGQAKKLKIKSLSYTKALYTDDEVNFIKANWKQLNDLEMAEILNRSFRSVKWKRGELQLFRTKDELSYDKLSVYLRKNNSLWKKKSVKNCNYKCVLTGERFEAIHHKHGFNLILNETLDRYNILLKEIHEYTIKDLGNIVSCFHKIQNEYPLGICLSQSVHKLFHDTYGYGYNTDEQWVEFDTNFRNGKYGSLLQFVIQNKTLPKTIAN